MEALEVSPFDTRSYDTFALGNGLEVLLCHDADAEQSAACMCVKAGALLDPIPGTAHLLEHMLFVSSHKYPQLSEYQEFVSRHAGQTNAFTGSEHTCFFFALPTAAFAEAFDRFAQFFVGPSFVPDAVEREIKAVDAEHTKNVNNDSWGLLQMMRSSASPDVPYNHFATGSETTLWTEPRQRGVDIVEVIRKFHADFYAPHMMKLVVIGAQPLAEMRAVVEGLFSAIPSKSVALPTLSNEPWSKQYCGRVFRLVPTSTSHTVRCVWALPEAEADYRYGASAYISHCLGHESDGSLLAELKHRGWANQLMAGHFEATSQFVVFGCECDLTSQGLEHVDDVVALMFSYIAMLRAAGPQHALWQEMGAVARQSFLFAEKREPSETAVAWATTMATSRLRKHYLHSGLVLEQWDAPRIAALLDLLSVDRCNVFIRSPLLEGNTDQTEPHYSTPYSVGPLDAALIARCRDICSGVIPPEPRLHVPAPNPFVATDFELLPALSEPVPIELLCNDRFCQVWYKRDSVFRKPTAHIVCEVRLPLAYCSAHNSVLCALFCAMLEDSLKSLSYYAEMAQLKFQITNTDNGLLLILSGFSHKLPALLMAVLEALEGSVRSDGPLVWPRFEALREALMRRYQNFDLTVDAFRRAQYYETLPVQTPRWTQAEYLDELRSITAATLKAFLPQLLSQVYFRALLCGNIAQPWKIVDRMRLVLFGSGKALPVSRLQNSSVRRMVKLPKGKTVFDRPAGSPTDANNAMCFTFQAGRESILASCVLNVFNALVTSPLFAQLRGQKQLGYVVASYVRRELGVLSWYVLLQTDRRPELAESLVAAFIQEDVAKLLADLTPEILAEIVQSLIAVSRQPFLSIAEEAAELWARVEDFSLHFDRRADVASLLESGAVTVDKVREFYATYIAPRAPQRRLLVTRVLAGPESAPASTLGIEEKAQPVPVPPAHDVAVRVVALEDLADFRRSRPLFPCTPCHAKL